MVLVLYKPEIALTLGINLSHYIIDSFSIYALIGDDEILATMSNTAFVPNSVIAG